MSESVLIICLIIGAYAVSTAIFVIRIRRGTRKYREETARYLEEARTKRYREYGNNIMKGIYD
jgi:hypothetical protein